MAGLIADNVKDAKIYVADINSARVDEIVAKYRAKGVDMEAIAPEDVLFAKVDVLSPCAMGGILSEETIPKLNCKIIWGSANNQIKASSVEEECRLSKLLAERNILFQTDWWHNTAGVMFGYEEYKYQKDASLKRTYDDIDRVLPKNTWLNLNKAKELGLTPTECAYKTAMDELYGDD